MTHGMPLAEKPSVMPIFGQGYLLLSTRYDSKPVTIVRISFFVRLTLARTWASRKLGTAIAARMAMMATTMSNSIKVKAVSR